jgi:hypothetical protein
MTFVLVGPKDGTVSHVVSGKRWLRERSAPRARCGARINDRWIVLASTDYPVDLRKTDCCARCRGVPSLPAAKAKARIRRYAVAA